MGNSRYNVAYDDVYDSVQSLLDAGASLNEMSLRMIREHLGDRGSLATIAKHFGPIKERLERGEAIDSEELTETDMSAIRGLLGEIIERRTVLARKEKEDSAQAMSDVIRANEAELAVQADIIDDLEHQVFALEGEVGVQTRIIETHNAEVARLQGMVEALNTTIAKLSSPHKGFKGDDDNDDHDGSSAVEADTSTDVQVDLPLSSGENTDRADGEDVEPG